jgi:hypothetical protein
MHLTFVRVALIATLVIPVAACSSVVRTPESVLEEHVNVFHQHLRWGRVSEASGFVEEADREAFLGAYDALGDDYEVTEYEIETIELQDDRRTAVVEVWVQWWRLPSTRVRETTYEEAWEYDEDLRTWRMIERVSIDED